MSSCLRGFLRIVTLKALADGEKSGYGLMKFIEEKVGDRPSSGSIYPLLEKLQEEGQVTAKKQGRSTLYSLTPQGKKKLAVVEKKRSEILEGFIDGMKMIEALTGEDLTMHKLMIGQVQKGEVPFKEINPEWIALKTALFERWKAGKLKEQAPRIKKLIKKTYQELKRI